MESNINETFIDEKITKMPNGLTHQEIEYFNKNGWVGSFPLLTDYGVEKATIIHHQSSERFRSAGRTVFSFINKPWYKSMHISIKEYRDIVSHPFIVEKVASLLGDNIIAWGTTSLGRLPGEKKRWHVDIEHKYWKGVSVFLGLKGASKLSSLKVVTGSHLLNDMPQSLHINEDDKALAFCKQTIPDCEVVNVELNEGEFFLFDGTVWHASENKSGTERIGMLIQYSTPDQKVRIPRNFDEPIRWHPIRPTCLLVKGADKYKINRLK